MKIFLILASLFLYGCKCHECNSNLNETPQEDRYNSLEYRLQYFKKEMSSINVEDGINKKEATLMLNSYIDNHASSYNYQGYVTEDEYKYTFHVTSRYSRTGTQIKIEKSNGAISVYSEHTEFDDFKSFKTKTIMGLTKP